MATTKRGRGSAADQRQRQQDIHDFVSQTGSRTVEEIALKMGVSTMTIYRDLNDLEALGMLRLAKGVVNAAASNLHEAASRYRITQSVAEKEALAEAALTLVEPGSAIMLDDSSTGVFLAHRLHEKTPMTVVTNYFPVAEKLKETLDVRLLMTGGEYLFWADALMGPTAVQMIRSMRADATFMSASAVTDGIVFHPTETPAEVKRAMLAASRLKVLYVDHTKFTRTALHTVAPVADFDVLIVDAKTDSAWLEPYAGTNLKIIQTQQ